MRWNTEIQGHNPQMGQPFILKWHIAKCWLILIIERSLKYTIQRKTEQHQSTNNVAVFLEKRKKNYKKNLVHLVKQTTEFMFNVFNKTGLFTYNVSPNYR